MLQLLADNMPVPGFNPNPGLFLICILHHYIVSKFTAAQKSKTEQYSKT